MSELERMTFDEIVKIGIERELDAFVTGEKLKSRVWSLVELGARWQYQRLEAEGRIKPPAKE